MQTCELVNLADLATETDHVRSTITAYLEDLLSLGIDGFRIDAAKHMPAEDIAAIVAGLPEGTGIAQEVIRGSGEPITPEQYLGNGQVFEFGYAQGTEGVLAGCPRLALELGRSSGFGCRPTTRWCSSTTTTPSATARRSVRRRRPYRSANVLMLASATAPRCSTAATPSLDRDAGPPQDADGRVVDASCASGGPTTTRDWVCQHRWPAVAGMVGVAQRRRRRTGDDEWSEGDA